MAAGADAHAATVPPPGTAGAAMSTMLAGTAAPRTASPLTTGAATSAAAAAAVGATQLHKAAATGQAPVITGAPPIVTTPPPTPTPLAPPEKRRSPLALVAVIGVILVLLVVTSAAFAFTNGFGMLARATETATQAPSATTAPTDTEAAQPTATTAAGTATPDLVATQFAVIQLTQDAFQAALATATPTQTPDLTATFEACTFAYALTEQEPPDGRTLTTGANTRKTLTITNTGDCAYPAGTVMTETVPSPNLPGVQFDVPPVAPGEVAELFFDWPGLRQAGTMTRVFEMRLPGDLVVGEPMTFTYRYAPAATQRPANTNTPAPPPATATSSVAPLTDLFPQNHIGCFYQGIDYRCSAVLSHVGGSGPYTLYVNDVRIGQFSAAETLVYDFVGRRCLNAVYTIRLVDDGTVSQIAESFFFDPTSDPALFPGGGCTE
jgi:hypothetical protein